MFVNSLELCHVRDRPILLRTIDIRLKISGADHSKSGLILMPRVQRRKAGVQVKQLFF